MADPRKQYELVEEVESALGDGNCGLNAFALGLFTEEVLNGISDHLGSSKVIPELEDFFREIVKTNIIRLNESELLDWPTLTVKLSELRQQNKAEFQKLMAGVLRNLAIRRAEKDEKFKDKTYELLTGAFHNRIFGARLAESDDFFQHMGFAKDELEKHANKINVRRLRQLNVNARRTTKEEQEYQELDKQYDAACKALKIWWDAQGANLFLDEMKKPRTWVGDLELAYLAQIFHVNLMVYRPPALSMPLHLNHGYFDKAELKGGAEDRNLLIRELVNRGIIDQTDSHNQRAFFLTMSHQELETRLAEVPDFEMITSFIAGHKNLNGVAVPDDWVEKHPECITELRERDIITPDNRSDRKFKFNVGQLEASNRIQSIDKLFGDGHIEKIKKLYRDNYVVSPTITLKQCNRHWDNIHWVKKEVMPKSQNQNKQSQTQQQKKVDSSSAKNQIEAKKKNSAQQNPMQQTKEKNMVRQKEGKTLQPLQINPNDDPYEILQQLINHLQETYQLVEQRFREFYPELYEDEVQDKNKNSAKKNTQPKPLDVEETENDNIEEASDDEDNEEYFTPENSPMPTPQAHHVTPTASPVQASLQHKSSTPPSAHTQFGLFTPPPSSSPGVPLAKNGKTTNNNDSSTSHSTSLSKRPTQVDEV